MITIDDVCHGDATAVFEMASSLSMSFAVSGKHTLADLKQVLSDNSSILLIARDGKTAAGYLYGNVNYAFYAARNIARIEELFVKERYRRHGIGTALIKAAEAKARQQHSALISVTTRRAQQFYEKCGYELSAQYYRKLL
ncbi:GNAT family N-acetyltransferase [Methylophaga pinxianii]|uniref:GNAT family N-acetyltransferase n=1 Tax=Methylophaga pinxianii TaxID=2881052 RepID=UPI001CF37CEE|nr:GNAT family N-acetyltransferase [Methylophaga pinxianii]MCB2427124.1 GNAT family N-acetyltransferase [Methylophaga pinxianii]UPH44973.1 GNAT family N-acetyltransferase [Methylophaga pinxianii]